MKSFNLIINKAYKIGFRSEDIEDNQTNIELMAKNYLPGCEIDSTGNAIDLEIEYIASKKKKLEIGDKKIIIFDDWEGKLSLDLWHLLYSVVRIYYLGIDGYPIHAACLGKNNYMLLVGHSGVGKTTLMLRLANDLGAKIWSGNKTVINIDKGEFVAVAATKAISLREEEVRKYPLLKDKLTMFSNRAALFLDKDSYLSADQVKIRAIFVVKINDNGDETVKLETPSDLHLLYPYFMDTVYADTIMCGGDDVFSGAVGKEISAKLAQKLAHNLGFIKSYKVTGSVKYIVSEVQKWL